MLSLVVCSNKATLVFPYPTDTTFNTVIWKTKKSCGIQLLLQYSEYMRQDQHTITLIIWHISKHALS